MKKTINLILAMALLGTTVSTATYAENADLTPNTSVTSVPYEIDNVAFGGGGYVLGVKIHPKNENLVFARTDIGGSYRWDADNSRWWPLNESLSYKERNLYGIDGIALDPNDENTLYLCAGKYTAQKMKEWGALYPETGLAPCEVLKSTDKGESWVRTGLTVDWEGNGVDRYYGEPIMVDPQNSNIVYVMSRKQGLWRTKDGAVTWEQVSSFPELPDNTTGRIIAFVPNSGTERSEKIIAGVRGLGVCISLNGGTSWELIEGSPSNPTNIKPSCDGSAVYVSHDTGISKYDFSKWTDVSPAGPRICRIDTHPTDKDTVIAIMRDDTNSYYNHHTWISKNGGESWTDLFPVSEVEHTVPWYPDYYFSSEASSISFNPLNPKQVWISDWYGVWRTDDIDAKKIHWINEISGIEEMVGFAMSCPPVGAPLLAGSADNDGARWEDIHKYPKKQFSNPLMQDTIGIDFCEEDPNFMARTGGNRSNGHCSVSTDNGVTWTETDSFPSRSSSGSRIAVAAAKDKTTGCTSIVQIPVTDSVYFSKDNGKSWNKSGGLPSNLVSDVWYWNNILASDRVNPNYFYIAAGKKLYMSYDGGENFILINNSLPSIHHIKAAPGIEGEIWCSSGQNGLYASSDAGRNFRKVSGVDNCLLFAWGKEAPSRKNPTAYVYGTVNGTEGIFRSVDMGETWVRVNDDEHRISNEPNALEGDRQTFGVYYVSTNGRGFSYGKPISENSLADEELLPQKDISVFVNNRLINTDVAPISVNDRTLLPFRAIFEALGASVSYDENSGTISGRYKDIDIEMRANSSTASVNGTEYKLDAQPCIINDRTMVPVRFVSESIHADVKWDEKLNSVFILLPHTPVSAVDKVVEQVPAEITDNVNLALGKSVNADSEMKSHIGIKNSASLVTDGIINDGSRWISNDTSNHYLEINLGKNYDVNRINLYSGFGDEYPVSGFIVQYYRNGKWQNIEQSEVTNNELTELSVDFDTINAQLFRIKFYDSGIVRIKEIELINYIK